MILGNFWRRFADLLPKTPRNIGTVVSVLGSDRYVVQLMGGGVVQVTSSATFILADRVFITDKRIDSKAPNLPPVTIDI
jgi:hypothetical protein